MSSSLWGWGGVEVAPAAAEIWISVSAWLVCKWRGFISSVHIHLIAFGGRCSTPLPHLTLWLLSRWWMEHIFHGMTSLIDLLITPDDVMVRLCTYFLKVPRQGLGLGGGLLLGLLVRYILTECLQCTSFTLRLSRAIPPARYLTVCPSCPLDCHLLS